MKYRILSVCVCVTYEDFEGVGFSAFYTVPSLVFEHEDQFRAFLTACYPKYRIVDICYWD